MRNHLLKLADSLQTIEPEIAETIRALAGRYDKAPLPMPYRLQPAFKYIMYLKLIHNLDDMTFHHMKRKYLNTSTDIQLECQKELDKIINQDAMKFKRSSAEIRKDFEEKLRRANYLMD